MDKIIPFFEKTIFDSSLVDSCIDLSEIGIDSLIDNPIVEGIPFVKLLLGITKTTQNIYERNLLRQTFNFIKGFNDGKLDNEKLTKYRDKIFKNEKTAEELGRVLIILNKNVDIKKSVILGRFFRAYINENISWDDFCDLADVTDRLFISDISTLTFLRDYWVSNIDSVEFYRGYRLNALGLVDIGPLARDDGEGNVDISRTIFLNEFGKKFVDYGLQ